MRDADGHTWVEAGTWRGEGEGGQWRRRVVAKVAVEMAEAGGCF